MDGRMNNWYDGWMEPFSRFTLCSGHLIEKLSSLRTQPENNNIKHGGMVSRAVQAIILIIPHSLPD